MSQKHSLNSIRPKCPKGADGEHNSLAARCKVGVDTGRMTNPWKWIAIVLGAALVALALITILLVGGVMDVGMSIL
jgi:hypothetical protein